MWGFGETQKIQAARGQPGGREEGSWKMLQVPETLQFQKTKVHRKVWPV